MIKNIAGLFLFIMSFVGFSNMFAQVDSVFTNSKIIDEEFIEDPSRNKLFFAPTAKNLKAGSGSVGFRVFLNPYFSIGITDKISASTSILMLPPYLSYLSFSTQINFYSHNNIDIAAGAFYLNNLETNELQPFFYGVSTFSTSGILFNIGSGFNPLSKDYFIFVGGEIRTASDNKLIIDNWLLQDGTTILSFGGKTFSRRFSFALGLITLLGKGTTNIGAWIEFAVHF